MNKFLVFLVAAFALTASSVSACHCVDNDTPYVLPNWGDDGLLGGTSTGWADTLLPEGCTGVQGDYTCNDMCIPGTNTLREFYCSGDTSTTYIHWNDYENSAACGYEVPEFGVIAGAVALVGALGVFLYRRK